MRRTVLPLLLAAACAAPAAARPVLRFAVSGDSRDCGDVVMPAIARGVLRDGASFYWHLGDLRKTYDFDGDYLAAHGKTTISRYLKDEWPDFIASQIQPFGAFPFYLGLGNHETIAPKSRAEFLTAFADWLEAPALRERRLADDPSDHALRAYYRWIQGGVDFVALDNGSDEMFDDAQVAWFEKALARDRADASVRAVVAGMHRALPNSLSCGHSMNETAQGTASGRRVYRDLLRFKAETGKPVYILASHSHFALEDVYATPYWSRRAPDRGVLPGWIVGAAGAVRYPLPDGIRKGALASSQYGYLLGEAAADGSVRFRFRPVGRADVPAEVEQRFGKAFVDECFAGNKDPAAWAAPSPSCSDE